MCARDGVGIHGRWHATRACPPGVAIGSRRSRSPLKFAKRAEPRRSAPVLIAAAEAAPHAARGAASRAVARRDRATTEEGASTASPRMPAMSGPSRSQGVDRAYDRAIELPLISGNWPGLHLLAGRPCKEPEIRWGDRASDHFFLT